MTRQYISHANIQSCIEHPSHYTYTSNVLYARNYLFVIVDDLSRLILQHLNTFDSLLGPHRFVCIRRRLLDNEDCQLEAPYILAKDTRYKDIKTQDNFIICFLFEI